MRDAVARKRTSLAAGMGLATGRAGASGIVKGPVIVSENSSAFADLNRAALVARWGRTLPDDLGADGRAGHERPGVPELRGADGMWLPVSTAPDPAVEALRWLDAVAGDRALPTAACIIGSGTGHAIDALLSRAPDMRLLVLEPEPAFAGLLLQRRDWRASIDAGRLLVLAGPGYDGAGAAWRLLDGEPDPLLLVHPVICRARPDAARAAARVIGRAKSEWTMNREARRLLGARYAQHTLANLPRFAASGDVTPLTGLGRGRAAIVAGAGPSLNANLEAVARVPGLASKALVIATDTAHRPCLAAGVVPDFTVAVDASEANARHLTAVPPSTTCLIAEPSLAPLALDAWEGRTRFFRVAAHDPWPLLRSLGVDRGLLSVFGSVLTAAADLAVRLGCDPIVFVGADLAYTGGQPYCRGTVYDADWAHGQAQGFSLEELWRTRWMKTPLVEVPGIEGALTETAAHFIAFRDWLTDLSVQRRDRRFVNATGSGILQGGAITLATVDDVVGALPSHPPVNWPPVTDSAGPAHLVEQVLALGPDALAAMPGAEDEGDSAASSTRHLLDGLEPALTARATQVSIAGAPAPGPILEALALAEQQGDIGPLLEALDGRSGGWRALDLVQSVNRAAALAARQPVESRRPLLLALLPLYQAALVDGIAPGLAAGMLDQLHDLCWHARRHPTDLEDFIRDVVDPFRAHARAWGTAVGLEPRRTAGAAPITIGYLGYNTSLDTDHPVARTVQALIEGHARGGSVRCAYFAWRRCDEPFRAMLDAAGVPLHEYDWPSRPASAVPALRGAIAAVGVDMLVSDQNLGVPTVLFETRSAPLQAYLDLGFRAWSPALTDAVLTTAAVNGTTYGVPAACHIVIDRRAAVASTSGAVAAARQVEALAERLLRRAAA